MHESLAGLAPLLGTWRGRGRGFYPTIDTFDYVDEWHFTEAGKPFIHFVERTWIDGEARHTETGYLRCPAPGRIEIIAAIPTGQAECGAGTVTGDDALVITTEATVQNAATAKQVERIVRRFTVRGDELIYDMGMAAVGVELTDHLRATLHRAP